MVSKNPDERPEDTVSILSWLFEIIMPSKSSNAFSRAFSRWRHARRDAWNREIVNYDGSNSIYFNVTGAGKIKISKHPHSSCGKSAGFSFGVEWAGDHGYTGGVIGRVEALRLAEHILSECSKVKETEEEEIKRHDREFRRELFKSK